MMSQCERREKNSVYGDFSFSDGQLKLMISNESNQPLYLQTSIYDNICLYYEDRLINDPDILHNRGDLSPAPEPPTEEEGSNIKSSPLGTYLNAKKSNAQIDSVLYDYFLNKYINYNKLESFSDEDKVIFRVKLGSVIFINGPFLFLAPNESFTYDFDYTCFKHMHGRFSVQCCPDSLSYVNETAKFNIGTDAQPSILPYYLPPFLMGYKRFEGKIICKGYSFNSSGK